MKCRNQEGHLQRNQHQITSYEGLFFFPLSKWSYWCWETWIKEIISDSGGINEGKIGCAGRNSASHWSASPIFSVIAVLWISMWFAICYYCLCSFKAVMDRGFRGKWYENLITKDWIGLEQGILGINFPNI